MYIIYTASAIRYVNLIQTPQDSIQQRMLPGTGRLNTCTCICVHRGLSLRRYITLLKKNMHPSIYYL